MVAALLGGAIAHGNVHGGYCIGGVGAVVAADMAAAAVYLAAAAVATLAFS